MQRVGSFVALGTASEYAGIWAGSQFSYILHTPATQKLLVQASQKLIDASISSSSIRPLTSFMGGAYGGAITSVLFSFGSYWLGYSDLTTAQRSTIAGVTASAVGAAASAATLYTASVVGTAGTGAAISSLSGIAATNASLAWLGGGTVAAGGLGTAGGAVILSGGVALVVIATGAAVMYLYHIGDKMTEVRKVGEVIKVLSR